MARALYYSGDKGLTRVAGPGRHGPGKNLFSYYLDEDENVMEYTTEVEVVEENSPPLYWTEDHRPPADVWNSKKLR